VKKKRVLEIKAEPADEGRTVEAIRDAMARIHTLAGAPPEVQKFALYADNLRAKNRRAALDVQREGRSIRSVRAAERVAAYILEHGLSQAEFAHLVDPDGRTDSIDEKTLRHLLKNKRAKASTWAYVAKAMDMTLERLLDLDF
jgi:hypothetical protein